MKEFRYQEISKKIMGAAMKAHSTLGDGFPEVINQRALAIEFTWVGLLLNRKLYEPIFYVGEIIGKPRVDFFKDSLIGVVLKSWRILEPSPFSQAGNYLGTHNLEIGWLPNFGNISLKYKRIEKPKYDPNLKSI